MRRLLPLFLVSLALAGCATRPAPDTQGADALEREAMKQALERVASAQAIAEARLAQLEAAQALMAGRLDAGADAQAAVAALRSEQENQAAALRRQLDALRGDVADAREQADDAVRIARDSRLVSGKLVDSLLLTERMVLFGYERPELTAEGRVALDTLIAGVRPRLPHVFVEIIGYTDNQSLDSQNRRAALERAESVRRYLHEIGDIPLDRMSTISYGDLKPVASNTTFEGREQNRRVLVRVLK